MEEEILKYWKENKIFEKSVESRPKDKKWTFLDGPPFVTGMPHYGHLLGSIHKDVFGRYWTMKGYRVRRVWGWDGHGLPVENKVENKLEIKRKKDIEDVIGVKKFIEECKKYVEQISEEWEWYIDHIGRWVDFKNAYKTWDRNYMESVMWVFKQMYDRGYVYKGLKISLYCPHCATPVSNFEVAMDSDNYKEVEDPTTTYKYKLESVSNTYILAWSTTPWNKIVTSALAVNPKLTYVKVKQGIEYYIIAKPTIKTLKDEPYRIVDEFKGKELIGKKFEPHYDYYKKNAKGKLFEIVGGDFVTADEGTGVVTIAVYGEEDLKLMNEENIHKEIHLDEEGNVLSHVPKFGGMYYLFANKAINEDLANRGLIYSNKQKEHSVPLCWRCHTRLYYAPINAWYVDIQTLKPLMKKTNEEVNWYPKHFKYGRFLKSLENAPDWNISRNRYWGSPVPVWECECGERFVPGSIKELEEACGQEVKDLHKPLIDEITIKCKKCDRKVHRVPEVLDSWIEAGSASFAERHFPFDPSTGHSTVSSDRIGSGQAEKLEDFFPPDFIAEYTGQIRAWFYVLHVIGAALYKSPAFKNVGVEGVILGSDGRKMSKNLGNYPDPKGLLQKYGGDALRLYLMGSAVMNGEDLIISEEHYRNQVKGMMLVLWNVYNFFVSYSNLDKWIHSKENKSKSENMLDKWILSLLTQLIEDTTSALDKYDTVTAISKINNFVNDLSTWYVRRSRDRVGLNAEDKKDKDSFYNTTFQILVTLSKLLAPIAPFVAEEIYRNLTEEESVHLSVWPIADNNDKKLEEDMTVVRKIVEMGHAKRKASEIKLRQPLKQIMYISAVRLSSELEQIVSDELNVKEIVYGKPDTKATEDLGLQITLDITLTEELKAEGNARDVVRKIQEERKNLGTTLDEKVDVVLPDWPKEFEDYIKNRALVKDLKKGEKFSVLRK